jgi:hypothetical protein
MPVSLAGRMRATVLRPPDEDRPRLQGDDAEGGGASHVGQGASQGNAVGRRALYSEAHTSDWTGVPPGYNGEHSRGRGTRARQLSIGRSAQVTTRRADPAGNRARARLLSNKCRSMLGRALFSPLPRGRAACWPPLLKPGARAAPEGPSLSPRGRRGRALAHRRPRRPACLGEAERIRVRRNAP